MCSLKKLGLDYKQYVLLIKIFKNQPHEPNFKRIDNYSECEFIIFANEQALWHFITN